MSEFTSSNECRSPTSSIDSNICLSISPLHCGITSGKGIFLLQPLTITWKTHKEKRMFTYFYFHSFKVVHVPSLCPPLPTMAILLKEGWCLDFSITPEGHFLQNGNSSWQCYLLMLEKDWTTADPVQKATIEVGILFSSMIKSALPSIFCLFIFFTFNSYLSTDFSGYVLLGAHLTSRLWWFVSFNGFDKFSAIS